jgi:hypothetical protein
MYSQHRAWVWVCARGCVRLHACAYVRTANFSTPHTWAPCTLPALQLSYTGLLFYLANVGMIIFFAVLTFKLKHIGGKTLRPMRRVRQRTSSQEKSGAIQLSRQPLVEHSLCSSECIEFDAGQVVRSDGVSSVENSGSEAASREAAAAFFSDTDGGGGGAISKQAGVLGDEVVNGNCNSGAAAIAIASGTLHSGTLHSNGRQRAHTDTAGTGAGDANTSRASRGILLGLCVDPLGGLCVDPLGGGIRPNLHSVSTGNLHSRTSSTSTSTSSRTTSTSTSSRTTSTSTSGTHSSRSSRVSGSILEALTVGKPFTLSPKPFSPFGRSAGGGCESPAGYRSYAEGTGGVWGSNELHDERHDERHWWDRWWGKSTSSQPARGHSTTVSTNVRSGVPPGGGDMSARDATKERRRRAGRNPARSTSAGLSYRADPSGADLSNPLLVNTDIGTASGTVAGGGATNRDAIAGLNSSVSPQVSTSLAPPFVSDAAGLVAAGGERKNSDGDGGVTILAFAVGPGGHEAGGSAGIPSAAAPGDHSWPLRGVAPSDI